MPDLINPEHHDTLVHLAANSPSAPVRRRATLLLLYDAGHATAEVARKAGLSVSSVLRWRRLYREQGMGVFPASAYQPAPAPKPLPSEPTPETDAQPKKKASPKAEEDKAEKAKAKKAKAKAKKAKAKKAKAKKGKKGKAKKGKAKKKAGKKAKP